MDPEIEGLLMNSPTLEHVDEQDVELDVNGWGLELELEEEMSENAVSNVNSRNKNRWAYRLGPSNKLDIATITLQKNYIQSKCIKMYSTLWFLALPEHNNILEF